MPIVGPILKLYDRYDATFLTMLGMQYFNQGTKVLVYLAAADLFKAYYHMDPGRVQTLQAFTFLPWSIKIVYGLISDNFPIFGSRRKSYLLIMSLLQFLSMIILGMISTNSESENLAAWMLFISNLSIAFSDVIVDSLMVIQARRYPEDGGEELNSFSWTCMAIGGLIGSIAAAILTESYNPSYCFYFSSLMGLIIVFYALRLDVSLETEGLEDAIESNLGFWHDLKRNCREIVEAMKIKEFYQMILYLVVGGFLVPSFGSFGYYFMLDVVGISKFTYSMLTVLGFVSLLFGTQMFNKYFKDREWRNLIMLDALISIFIAPLTFIFIFRINLDWGISDMFMIIFTDTVAEIVSQCFVFLPMSVIMTKICPKHIEATSFALLAGVSNFRGTVRGWMGSWINEKWVGVTQEDLSDYWVLVLIGTICSFLPLFFLWLIPTRKGIEDLQKGMEGKEDDKDAAKSKKEEDEI